ncbi:MAG: response regulator transcription factor [Desulfobaccales bacterium]
MEPYRIMLAEDHIIFRDLIKQSLTEIPGLEVVGEVGDGLELLESIAKVNPHMVILDIGLPHLSGLEAAVEIKQAYPGIKVLLLTMYKTKDHLAQAMAARVDGYLLKENAFKDLLIAVDTIRDGRLYISSLLTPLMMERFAQGRTSGHPTRLTPRERQLLKYVAEGESNNEIAKLMLISEQTVRIHLNNIKNKLHIRSRTELMRYALKKGIASLTE